MNMQQNGKESDSLQACGDRHSTDRGVECTSSSRPSKRKQDGSGLRRSSDVRKQMPCNASLSSTMHSPAFSTSRWHLSAPCGLNTTSETFGDGMMVNFFVTETENREKGERRELKAHRKRASVLISPFSWSKSMSVCEGCGSP